MEKRAWVDIAARSRPTRTAFFEVCDARAFNHKRKALGAIMNGEKELAIKEASMSEVYELLKGEIERHIKEEQNVERIKTQTQREGGK